MEMDLGLLAYSGTLNKILHNSNIFIWLVFSNSDILSFLEDVRIQVVSVQSRHLIRALTLTIENRCVGDELCW